MTAVTPTCQDLQGGKHCAFWMVPPIKPVVRELKGDP